MIRCQRPNFPIPSQIRLGISFKRSTNTHTLATLGLVRFLIGASIVRTQPEPQYCVVPEDFLHDVIWSNLVIEVGQLDQEGTGFLCDKSLVSQNEIYAYFPRSSCTNTKKAYSGPKRELLLIGTLLGEASLYLD